MNTYKNLSFLALLMLILFSACRKDIDSTDTIHNPYTPPIIDGYSPEYVPVTASVEGNVIREGIRPIEGATVYLGSETTTTDRFGHFFFTNVEMNEKGTLVKVYKEGFFNGSRRFFAIDNTNHNVKIEMIPNYHNNFNSQDGAVINFGDSATDDITINGASVSFEPNSIANADGSIYNGIVTIARDWLSPNQFRTFDRMPGNLQGINEQNQEVALQTFGMIAIELEGANGEALNIAEGFTATISMEVPDALLNNAPAEIPLWYYHEDYGLWVEEGSATLQEGKYVGEVSHFSFWNCDYPGELIEISLKVENENGIALNNLPIRISADNVGMGWGHTSSNGSLLGLVPAGTDLELEILDYCGDPVHTQSLGVLNDDADLETITVTLHNISILTGTLLGCDGNPTTGVIKLDFNEGYTFHYISENPFSFVANVCEVPEQISIKGYDTEELTEGLTSYISYQENLNVGNIDACVADLAYFVEVTYDNQSFIFPDGVAAHYIDEAVTSIQTLDSLSSNVVSIYFVGLSPGDYSENNFISNVTVGPLGLSLLGALGFENFEVTEYSSTAVAGQCSNFIEEYDVDGNPVIIECTIDFRVRPQ